MYGVEFVNGLVVDASLHAVQELEEGSTGFEVRLADGTMLLSRKLLFATGIRDRLPQIPGISECYGISVHHCPYCDGWEHRDSQLVAFGETPESVVSLAETLLRWSDRVTVVTGGRSLGASEQSQLGALGVPYHEGTVARLEHDAGTLRGLRFSSGECLAADALFFSARSEPCCHLPVQLGCCSGKKGRIETTERQGTGVPGVFLAGDADGEVQFAIVAASGGAIAGMAVNKELQQEDLAKKRMNRTRPRC
jgi:thioredoxin reductase